MLTFAILSRSNQVKALLAHGRSPFQTSAPLVGVTIAACLGLFYLSETVLPAANTEQDAH